jgi:SAM-dependent MidA family methyltransferase
VDPDTGDESVGPAPSPRDQQWLDEWWPLTEHGDRAEVGHPRDDAWAAAVRSVRRGIAVAVDYAHERGSRPAGGSLTGYRAGRQVAPVPDGSCDITSHVALDACATAADAGATWTLLTTQQQALSALGVDATLPSREQATREPAAYLAALSRASQAAELTATSGLGSFGWLVQGVGVPMPATFTRLAVQVQQPPATDAARES